MKLLSSASGILALGMAISATQASSAGPDPSPAARIGGAWKLNRELSENPAQKMMDAMRTLGGPGGGRSGGGGMGGGGRSGGGSMGGGGMRGGGPGPGGAGAGFAIDEPPLDGTPEVDRRPGPDSNQGDNQSSGRRGPEQNGGRPRGRMAGPIPSPEFQIDQDGDNLAFRTEHNLRLLHSDGQKRKKENASGKAEVTAKFVKQSLVVETKNEQSGKRKETYTLREDNKLEIDFDISGSGRMPDLKFKLVYDAATGPPERF